MTASKQDIANAAPDQAFLRQLPELEAETAFFWTAGAAGRLKICQCTACQNYIHPPLPRCPKCGGDVAPSEVSGRGRVASFTINVQKWLPGMPVPFVFAAIELEEQKQLYVLSNIIGAPVEDVRIGMQVEVEFERHEDVFLPLFRLTGAANAV